MEYFGNSSTTGSQSAPTDRSTAFNPAAAYPAIMPLQAILFSSMSLLGVILNLGTLVIVRSSKSFKESRIKLLLTNKATSDLMTSLTHPVVYAVLPFLTAGYIGLTPFVVSLIGSVSIYTSLLLNAVISVERFLAIYFPFKALTGSKKTKILSSISVWLLGTAGTAAIGLITIMDCNGGILIGLNVKGECEMKKFDRHNDEVIAFAAVPVLLILVMYILITVRLCRSNRTQAVQLSIKENEKRQGHQKRITIMLMTDAFMTILTWIPWRLILDKRLFCHEEPSKGRPTPCFQTVHMILFAIWLSNCFMTPIVYYSLNKSFRVSTAYLSSEQFRNVSPIQHRFPRSSRINSG